MAQLFSDQNILTPSLNAPKTIASADFDQDGDVDLVSASSGDNKIALYENLGFS